MIPILILQHPKENRKKCTLEPLRGQDGVVFRTAKQGFAYDATGDLVLSVDGEELAAADREIFSEAVGVKDDIDLAKPRLVVLDATWRLLPRVEACLTGQPIRRRLPDDLAVTAYPRVSKLSEDPVGGLASIEALYLALRILGEDRPTLLEAYPWREAFLGGLGAWAKKSPGAPVRNTGA